MNEPRLSGGSVRVLQAYARLLLYAGAAALGVALASAAWRPPGMWGLLGAAAGALAVAGLGPGAEQVFRLARVAEIVPLCPTIQEAVWCVVPLSDEEIEDADAAEGIDVSMQTVVDAADPAFAAPTKFVGPVYPEREARRLAEEHGWRIAADGAHWRRVVASPEPLRLVESDDPLEAGLEIYACPPGKRLASMSLMSGDEQALTASALIFAVFLAQPAPICVLDEVDAPLDDANVDR